MSLLPKNFLTLLSSKCKHPHTHTFIHKEVPMLAAESGLWQVSSINTITYSLAFKSELQQHAFMEANRKQEQ